MYLNRADVVSDVSSDCSLEVVDVEAVVFQRLLWDDMTECRVHLKGGMAVTCLFDGDRKVGKFKILPAKQEAR